MAVIEIVVNGKQAEAQLTGISKKFDNVDKSANTALTTIKSFAAGYIGFSALSSGLQTVITDFKKLESAALEVGKTTGLSGKQLKSLTDELDTMATTMNGFEISGLYDIAAAAGQLGIQGKDNIAKFTKEMQYMVSSSKLSAEEAASGFAQLSNVLNVPIKEINKLTSTFSALSATTTASEGDLLNFTQRLAGAGKTLGLTNSQIVAIGATLKDVGVGFEVGGTAISQVFLKMLTNTREFARVSGVSFKEFSRLVKDEPIKAIQLLLTSLGGMEKAAKIEALKILKIEGSEATNVLLKMSDATGKLASNMATADKAYQDGTATMKEYLSASDALAQAETKREASVKLMSRALGEELKPLMIVINDLTTSLSTTIKNNASDIASLTGYITAAGAAWATWKAGSAIIPVITSSLTAMSASARAATVSFESLGVALKGLFISNAPLIAIAALFEAWLYVTRQEAEAQQLLQQNLSLTADEILKMTNAQRENLANSLAQSLQEGRTALQEINTELQVARHGTLLTAQATQEEITAIQAAKDTQIQKNQEIQRQIDLVNGVTNGTYQAATAAQQEAGALNQAANETVNVANGAANMANNISYATQEAYNLANALSQAGANLANAQAGLAQAKGQLTALQAASQKMQNTQNALYSQQAEAGKQLTQAFESGDDAGVKKWTAEIQNLTANVINAETQFLNTKSTIEKSAATASTRSYKSAASEAKRYQAAQLKQQKIETQAYNEQIKNQQYVNDAVAQSTLNQTDFKKYQLDQQLSDLKAKGATEIQLEKIKAAELSKINQSLAKENSKWDSATQKIANAGFDSQASSGTCRGGSCGKNNPLAAMSGDEAQRAAYEGGKTFGDSFRDAISGNNKETQKSYESLGSKLGDAIANSIRGALTDYINGEGDITLREASRNQFDNQIGGAIRSEYPMIGLAADIISAMNTQTKNAFQSMPVDLFSDNTGIADALDTLNNTMYPHLKYTAEMRNSLSSISNNIGKISNTVADQYDFQLASYNFNNDTQSVGNLFSNGQLVANTLNGRSEGASSIIGGLVDSIFGTTTKNLLDTGITFGEQTLAEAIDGVINGAMYEDIQIKKSKMLGLVKSTKYKTNLTDLSSDTESAISGIFTEFYYGSLLPSLSAIGVDTSSISPESVKIFQGKDSGAIKASMKDLSTEEQLAKWEELFGYEFAKATEQILPTIGKYKTATEDQYSALIRVSSQYEEASFALKKLGIEADDFSDIAGKNLGNFDLDTIRQGLLGVYGLNTGLGQIVDTISTTDIDAQTFIDTYKSLEQFQYAMRVVGKGIEEVSNSMITGAGSIDALISAQQSYFDNYFTDQERSTIALSQLNREFNILGLKMPDTKAGFRSLVQSIDTTTEAGQELYGSLLTLSSGFSDAMEAMEAMTKSIESVRDVIFSASALSDYYKREYSKELYNYGIATNDSEMAIKYGAKYAEYIASTSYGLDAKRRYDNVYNTLSQKYGDQVEVQEVTDKKVEALLKTLISEIEEIKRTGNKDLINKEINGYTYNYA